MHRFKKKSNFSSFSAIISKGRVQTRGCFMVLEGLDLARGFLSWLLGHSLTPYLKFKTNKSPEWRARSEKINTKKLQKRKKKNYNETYVLFSNIGFTIFTHLHPLPSPLSHGQRRCLSFRLVGLRCIFHAWRPLLRGIGLFIPEERR